MDLIGIPVRLVMSPKTLEADQVEWKGRIDAEAELIPVDAVVARLTQVVRTQ